MSYIKPSHIKPRNIKFKQLCSFFSTKLFVTLSVLLLTVACACQKNVAKTDDSTSNSADKIVRPLSDNTVILEYNGGKITAKDVSTVVGPELKRAAEQALESYTQGARRILVQKLVEDDAKKQGVSPQDLVAKVAAAMPPVTDKDVDAFMKSRPELKTGVKNPRTGKVEKVSRDDIKKYLEAQNRQNAQQAYVEGLLAKASAKTVLEMPRVTIEEVASAPTLGGAKAKVTIQEFSDFQCPYCARAKNIVHQIHDTYGDKVKFVFRNFPLDGHPDAKPAAIAAVCASEQGKFWEFHDKLFENQSGLNNDNFNKWAKDLAMDSSKFSNCLKDPGTMGKIQKDLSDAEKVGVNSTPTFFVNGKRVAGALPFDEFRSMIDSELGK